MRSAKTLADERLIITKESAKIRTKLKDDHLPLDKRRKNIHKLLYLYILGEKTHFAQVECINLIASDDFRDKRLGYLAAMLLLDENQEILTLLTNMMNNDLNHPNRYVVSLALNTLGSLMSPELARDLYPDVENILNHSMDTYLLKKALQCAAKLVSRDVALLEIFYPYVEKIIKSHQLYSHGVLLGVTKLCQSALLSKATYEYDDYPTILSSLTNIIPDLFSLLQDLSSTNFNPEFDVNGTCDPFLQVEILYTLRLMFEAAPQETERYLDKLNDMLTQIATNVDGSKNSAHAVLYECVRTIFSLQLDQSLKVLGVNILAKFLSGKDNNNKYVALNTLLRVVPLEPQAVKRHRKFISRCLFDVDVSIKMRSLELTFAILDDSNMKELIEELIEFLEVSSEDDKDLITYIVEHTIDLFEIREINDDEWKLNIIVRIMKLVGQYISVEKIGDVLIMINNAQNMQFKTETIKKILEITVGKSKESVSEFNIGWKLMSLWSIGEYAELVLGQSNITDVDLTDYLCKTNNIYADDIKLISYALTAALKLSSKIQTASCIEDLRQLINSHLTDTNLMLQAKSSQYSILFNQPAQRKHAILEAMPLFTKRTKSNSPGPEKIARPTKPVETNLLLDLLDDIPTASENSNAVPDLLNDTLAQERNTSQHSNDVALNVNTRPENAYKNIVEIPQEASMLYESPNLQAFSEVSSSVAGEAKLEVFIKGVQSISNLHILAAVAKTQRLTLGPLSSTSVGRGEVAKQHMQITGSGKLKLRIKVSFTANGQADAEQFDHKFDITI